MLTLLPQGLQPGNGGLLIFLFFSDFFGWFLQRVAKRAAHQQRKEEEDAERMERIDFLEKNLIFKGVRLETQASFEDVSFAKGQQISRKLSSFLRHRMQNKIFHKNGGSIPLTDLAKLQSQRRVDPDCY